MKRLALLAGMLLLVLASCRSGGGSSLPDPEPFSPELEARLHEIRDQIAGIRGLSPNDDAAEGQVSREALRVYYDEEAAELSDQDREELEAFNIALRLMHLIGPEDDLLEIYSGEFSERTLGFYLFEEDELVLVAENATGLNDEDELVLAHEYVHSFQDTAFDSEALFKLAEEDEDGAPNEYSTTVSCLKEGDATVAMLQYADAVFGPDWRDTIDRGEDDENEPTDPDTPPGLERYFSFDYSECARFVMTLFEEGGWDAVDAAYEEPPWTTEQILHPEKYRSREDIRSGPPESLEDTLGDGWERIDLAVFGQFDVFNYLATVLEDEFAAAVGSAGWGSGWLSVYTADGDSAEAAPRVLVHLALDFDSENDLTEFMFAYGAVVETVAAGPPQSSGRNGPARWRGDAEFGYVSWDESRSSVDIVIASRDEDREAAVDGF